MADSLDYETCCKLVGQLFLESRYEVERITREAAGRIQELQQKLVQAEKERDDALKLIHRSAATV